MEEEKRYIENKYPNYEATKFNIFVYHINSLGILIENVVNFYKQVKVGDVISIATKKNKCYKDYSLFEGSGSYLLTYVKLFQFFRRMDAVEIETLKKNLPSEQHLYLKAEKYEADAKKQIASLEQLIQESENANKRAEFTFFFSPVGVYLLQMIFYTELKDAAACSTILFKIFEFSKYIQNNRKNPELYHEILYGTSGYLYVLLYIQKHCSVLLQDVHIQQLQQIINSIFTLILTAGFTLKEDDPQFRLVYNFHKREYIGGAHGLFGICQVLMNCIKQNPLLKEMNNGKDIKFVEKSIHFCSSLQQNSGNFPSGIHRLERDSLVQFCHGSPGAVSPLLIASQMFKDPLLLSQAEKAGENIWNFGILKKGFGICHGISGNAYSFLTLYKFTSDQKWLYYAHTFAALKHDKTVMEAIKNFDFPDRYVVGSSDYPFSYMLGLAGDISFLVDLLNPQTSLFLGYEI